MILLAVECYICDFEISKPKFENLCLKRKLNGRTQGVENRNGATKYADMWVQNSATIAGCFLLKKKKNLLFIILTV